MEDCLAWRTTTLASVAASMRSSRSVRSFSCVSTLEYACEQLALCVRILLQAFARLLLRSWHGVLLGRTAAAGYHGSVGIGGHHELIERDFAGETEDPKKRKRSSGRLPWSLIRKHFDLVARGDDFIHFGVKDIATTKQVHVTWECLHLNKTIFGRLQAFLRVTK